jgi:hypothetical protein
MTHLVRPGLPETVLLLCRVYGTDYVVNLLTHQIGIKVAQFERKFEITRTADSSFGIATPRNKKIKVKVIFTL